HRPGSNVGSYFRVDAGASLRNCDHFECGVWGQNLTDSQNEEALDTFFLRQTIEIPRSVYAPVQIRF
ncbi:MAG: hypothetical protein AAF517_21955, partial [Planctomycetota bacterium]